MDFRLTFTDRRGRAVRVVTQDFLTHVDAAADAARILRIHPRWRGVTVDQNAHVVARFSRIADPTRH